ncbi:hypothetical protein [Marinilactibacillus piezotolerans]|uniref:hypothetical protein n=1 Tax=Marinilactibacillus piezotolerans TaxID=258723 RepID=UPI0009AFFBFB|nr:hypothetical protein [Marinilactibacillus piezotolerans]
MNKKLIGFCAGAFILGFLLMYYGLEAGFFLGMVLIALYSFTAGPKYDQNPDDEAFKRDRQRIIIMMWVGFSYVLSGFSALFIG